jgi:hypothetical protein
VQADGSLRYRSDDNPDQDLADILGLSLALTSKNIAAMKFTKNIGMVLLAVYLIIDGLLGFGLNLGPSVFLLYVVALAAGVLILIGK